LVEAFRSTLEEALDADQLLLVVDLSDPGWQEQLNTVHRILDDLGSEAPRQLIANQIDRCPAAALEEARSLSPAVAFVSATSGLGLERLKQVLFDTGSRQAPA
jgi:GTP-binding protein HflX